MIACIFVLISIKTQPIENYDKQTDKDYELATKQKFLSELYLNPDHYSYNLVHSDYNRFLAKVTITFYLSISHFISLFQTQLYTIESKEVAVLENLFYYGDNVFVGL